MRGDASVALRDPVIGRASQLSLLLKPALLLIGWLIGLFLVVFREDVLPSQFRFDSDKIQRTASGQLIGDTSFDPVGAVYRAIGVADSSLVAGLLGYALFTIAMMVAYSKGAKGAASMYIAVLFALSGVLAGVYLGGYSKDAFVIPIVLLVLLMPSHWLSDAVIVAAMIVYATGFRSYWVLVAAGYVAYRIALTFVRRLRGMVLLLMLASVTASLGIFVATGSAPDTYRSLVNESRSEVATNTVIAPFVDGPEPFAGIVNNLLTQFALIVPVPLVNVGGLYYLFLAVVIAAIWAGFFLAARRVHRAGSPRSSKVVHVRVRRSIAIVLAFLTVQSVFEPDYGSALRHLVPMLPAMLVVALAGARSAQLGAEPVDSPAGTAGVGSR